MADSPANAPVKASLELKDYIDAATEAARGTRVVTIVLVVACVLVFIGFWNSFQWSWPHERLANAFDPEDSTIYGVLPLEDHPAAWPTELRATSIKDPLGLARKISHRADPLSAYLHDKLPEDLVKRLREGAEAKPDTEESRGRLAGELAAGLNSLLSLPYVYNEERFRKVKLSRTADGLAKRRPEDEDEVKRLNRLLLEDAYPNEIARSYEGSQAHELRRAIMWSSVRGYVENVRFVKAPFFGIAFDVNDLGLIGGIGLIIILLLLRHSLSREVKSLNKSFTEARRTGAQQFYHFYHILAMKLVFTIPEMKGETRNKLLALSGKLICVLPFAVFLLAVGYDWVSVVRLGLFKLPQVWLQLVIETALLGIIGYLSYRCWKKFNDLDNVWEKNWQVLDSERYGLVLLDKELVEEFGDDELVNDALRRWRTGEPYSAPAP